MLSDGQVTASGSVWCTVAFFLSMSDLLEDRALGLWGGRNGTEINKQWTVVTPTTQSQSSAHSSGQSVPSTVTITLGLVGRQLP